MPRLLGRVRRFQLRTNNVFFFVFLHFFHCNKFQNAHIKHKLIYTTLAMIVTKDMQITFVDFGDAIGAFYISKYLGE